MERFDREISTNAPGTAVSYDEEVAITVQKARCKSKIEENLVHANNNLSICYPKIETIKKMMREEAKHRDKNQSSSYQNILTVYEESVTTFNKLSDCIKKIEDSYNTLSANEEHTTLYVEKLARLEKRITNIANESDELIHSIDLHTENVKRLHRRGKGKRRNDGVRSFMRSMCILMISAAVLGGAVWGVVALAKPWGVNEYGLKYEYSHDLGGYVVYNGNSEKAASSTEIIIPEKINGRAVVGVKNDAFAGNTTLVSMTLPKTLKSVGRSAFYGCTSLVSVDFTGAETVICSYAFRNCSSLNELKSTSGINAIESYAFAGCTSFTEFKFPENTTDIDDYVLAGCNSVVDVTIPASLNSISEDMLSGTGNIEKLTYLGSKNQWNALEKESDWDFTVLTKEITCADGKGTRCTIKWDTTNAVIEGGYYATEYVSGSKLSTGVIPTPQYKNYPDYNYFEGWYLDPQYTMPLNSSTLLSDEETTVYAKWDLCTVYTSISDVPSTIYGRAIFEWTSIANTTVSSYSNLSNGLNLVVGKGNKYLFVANESQVFKNMYINIIQSGTSESEISFKDFNITSSNSSYIIGGNDANNVTLTMNVEGECSFTNNYSSGNVIYIPGVDINLCGKGVLNMKAGNGANGSQGYPDNEDGKDGGNGTRGGNGGCGLVAHNVDLKISGLNITAGNGGNGGRGGRGNNTLLGSRRDGGSGGNGGNGGSAISANYVNINSGVYGTLLGGDGGRGGDGGVGGGSIFIGASGSGGNGGNGGSSISATSGIGSSTSNLDRKGGSGGIGGITGGFTY